ncbi:MAG: AAA domain-containing protein [Porphyromonas sp.]|nr:AAA domain-containing protein [Porphyromonas sp.]
MNSCIDSRYHDAIKALLDELSGDGSTTITVAEWLLHLSKFLEMATIESGLTFERHYARLVYLRHAPQMKGYSQLCRRIVSRYINFLKADPSEAVKRIEVEALIAFIGLYSGQIETHSGFTDKEADFSASSSVLPESPLSSFYCVVAEEVGEDSVSGWAYSEHEGVREECYLTFLFCHPYQHEAYERLGAQVEKGSVIHLYDIRRTAEGIVPLIIVLRPDIILDVTSIAECFPSLEFPDPMLFLLSKLKPQSHSWYLLRGAVANRFLDDLLTAPTEHSFDSSFHAAFCANALGFAYAQLPITFGEEARQQYGNIQRSVDLLRREHFDSIALEAEIHAPLFGMRGRIDMISRDGSRLLELKSGKPDRSGKPQSAHAVQTTLYNLMSERAFTLSPEKRQSYLLYATTGDLFPIPATRINAIRAMGVRNKMVGILLLGSRNEAGGQRVWDILEEYLRLNSNSFDVPPYVREECAALLCSMGGESDPLLRAYQRAYFGFLLREEMAAYTVQHSNMLPDGTHTAPHSLPGWWHEQEGEAWTNLTLQANNCTDPKHPLLIFSWGSGESRMPEVLPEAGELLRLYPISSRTEAYPCLRCSVVSASAEGLTVRLLYAQPDAELLQLQEGNRYHLERIGGQNIGMTHQYRSVLALGRSTPRRRDIILTRAEVSEQKRGLLSDENDLDRIVRKVVSAKEYFLLVGPPGTGKTSHALRLMVERFLSEGKRIVLTAYTNRAVDEICATLEKIPQAAGYIKVGRESVTPDAVIPHLLSERTKHCKSRKEILDITENCSVFVGTTFSLLGHSLLWSRKPFDLLIVDEAAQLLETQLLGLLTATLKDNGEVVDAFKKFILIGDHKQLPAVVAQSNEGHTASDPLLKQHHMEQLSRSLFQRLLEHAQRNGYMELYDVLTFQGRMHPEVEAYPSFAFYDSLLKPLGLPHQQSALLPFAEAGEGDALTSLLKSERVLYLDTPREQHSEHKENKAEAEAIKSLVRRLLLMAEKAGKSIVPLHSNGADSKGLSLGIITPYRRQILTIRRTLASLLQDTLLLSKVGEKALNSLLDGLVIDTVERFQGSQRDIILYSVCTNQPFQISFLSASSFRDEAGKEIDRKLNVALTRARHQMILLGNREILSLSRAYKGYIERAVEIPLDTLSNGEKK